MRILYDTTYCFRGQSGIPRDSRCLARIIAGNQIKGDLLLFPKNMLSVDLRSLTGQSVAVSNSIRQNQGRDPYPHIIRLIKTYLKALVRKSTLKLYSVSPILNRLLEENLEIEDHLKGSLKISDLSVIERWARPKFRRSFKLPTKQYQIFIQQQIDPISISKKTKHVVRLHDIIPVTHPEYFDHQAVMLFTAGLTKLLRKSDINWVMDTHASFQHFKSIFGDHIKGGFVPCAIDRKFLTAPLDSPRENIILVLGTLEPRKRVDMALKAFLEVTEITEIDNSWKLIVAGNPGWQSDDLKEEIESRLSNEKVQYMQSPSDKQLLDLMSKSKVLITASVVEGFGLPPLEALAMGITVLASDIPQHRETLGEFADYFSSVEELVITLKDALISQTEVTLNVREKRRQHVLENYTEDILSQQWQTYFESL